MRLKQKLWFWGLMLTIALAGCKTDGFNQKEVDRIMESDVSEKMPLFTIENREDSLLLREVARPVKKKHIKSATVNHLKSRMLATVKDTANPGVGIAAPQVGIGVKMIYVQRYDKAGEPFEIYYNPKIITYGDSINSGQEGCLSVPNYHGVVDRSQNIEISYLDSVGIEHREEINGFTAVIFQHEIDHINGMLYYDHVFDGFNALEMDNEE